MENQPKNGWINTEKSHHEFLSSQIFFGDFLAVWSSVKNINVNHETKNTKNNYDCKILQKHFIQDLTITLDHQ